MREQIAEQEHTKHDYCHQEHQHGYASSLTVCVVQSFRY